MIKKGLLVAVLLLNILYSGCSSEKKEEKKEPVTVRTIKLNSTSTVSALNYVGTIEEESKINVSFKVQGTVLNVNVHEGQFVRKGTVLATLDIENLQQVYNASKATYTQAEDAVKRMKQMYDNQSLPEIKWIEAQTSLEQAKSAYLIAKKNLEEARLVAPIDGIIGKQLVEAGENVMPSQTVFTLLDIHTVKAKIAVPENEIPLLSTNDTACVNVPVLGKTLLQGRITEKGVDGNRLTHTYAVKIRLDNKERKIMPGMICNVAFSQGGGATFVLPIQCVQIGNQKDRFVWCVKDGKATAVKVEVGELTDKGVCIESGLTEETVVIIEGMQKVSEGMKVTVL
ncbi:MAG: efflux RND transporter periplasmic adaptor subunit [Parabacteroides sp.]|nr:efflux RND transporter periplasmic adaptor subunit [Parabacteroides sp.]